MIKHTAVSTDQRKKNIEEQVNLINYNGSETLAAFGIRVTDKEFLKVPARQLEPPEIQYSNGSAMPSKGQWQMNFGNRNMNFLMPATCLKWGVLNTDLYLDPSLVNSFVSAVCDIDRLS